MEGGWEEEQGEAGTPCVTWTLTTERLSVLALPQLSGFEKTFGVGGAEEGDGHRELELRRNCRREEEPVSQQVTEAGYGCQGTSNRVPAEKGSWPGAGGFAGSLPDTRLAWRFVERPPHLPLSPHPRGV